jgi:flavin-dependent dehydrogenase
VEGNVLRTFDEAGLGERVRAGKREERWVGAAAFPTFFRRAHGDGWALVGDAGYHKDPVTAQGIADALRYAEALADAVHTGLSGERPMREALADYERARDERAMPFAEWTHRMSALKAPSDKMRAVLRGVGASPEETAAFFGMNAATVSPAEFMAPANLQRIAMQGGAS